MNSKTVTNNLVSQLFYLNRDEETKNSLHTSSEYNEFKYIKYENVSLELKPLEIFIKEEVICDNDSKHNSTGAEFYEEELVETKLSDEQLIKAENSAMDVSNEMVLNYKEQVQESEQILIAQKETQIKNELIAEEDAGDTIQHIVALDNVKRKVFKCKVSTYSASRQYHFKMHMLSHSMDKPFKCNICNYCTNRKDNLTRHIKYHQVEKPYVCDVCNAAYVFKHLLVLHKRSHTNTFACEECDYTSTTKNNYLIHKKSHVTKNRRYFYCNLCPYSVAVKSTLKSHMENRHLKSPPQERRYRCDKCAFNDKDIALLVTHMKANH